MRTRLFRRCLVHANKDGESSEHEAAAFLPKFACVYLCIRDVTELLHFCRVSELRTVFPGG
jgi:hypothetical protein